MMLQNMKTTAMALCC